MQGRETTRQLLLAITLLAVRRSRRKKKKIRMAIGIKKTPHKTENGRAVGHIVANKRNTAQSMLCRITYLSKRMVGNGISL